MAFQTRINWEQEKDKLDEMGKAGYTYGAIGDFYGVTKERIRQIFRRFNLELPKTVRKKTREAAHYRKRGDPEQDDYRQKRHKFVAKKANAKREGKEFTILFGDLVWPKKCPILGLEIDYYAEGRQENSPSIDQIDPSKGYILGNVAVISWRANRIKNDGSSEEHEKIAQWIKNQLTVVP